MRSTHSRTTTIDTSWLACQFDSVGGRARHFSEALGKPEYRPQYLGCKRMFYLFESRQRFFAFHAVPLPLQVKWGPRALAAPAHLCVPAYPSCLGGFKSEDVAKRLSRHGLRPAFCLHHKGEARAGRHPPCESAQMAGVALEASAKHRYYRSIS